MLEEIKCLHKSVSGDTSTMLSKCSDCGIELPEKKEVFEAIPDNQIGFTPRQISDKYFKRLYAEALNILEVAVGEENIRLFSAKDLMRNAIGRLEDKIISVI